MTKRSAAGTVEDPTLRGFSRLDDEVYRDVPYVKGEVAKLAAQLAAVGVG